MGKVFGNIFSFYPESKDATGLEVIGTNPQDASFYRVILALDWRWKWSGWRTGNCGLRMLQVVWPLRSDDKCFYRALNFRSPCTHEDLVSTLESYGLLKRHEVGFCISLYAAFLSSKAYEGSF